MTRRAHSPQAGAALVSSGIKGSKAHRRALALLFVLALAACGEEEAGPGAGANAGTNNATANNATGSNNATNNNASNNASNNQSNNAVNNAQNSGDDAGGDVVEDAEADAADDVAVDADTDVEEVGDEVGADVVEEVAPDVPEFDCEGLRFTRDRYPTLPLRSLILGVEGGSGQYTWAFAAGGNRSGGELDTRNGFYLAGATEGVFDTIEVRDAGCQRTIVARVEVVVPARITPAQLRVPPQRRLCFTLSGGSGPSDGPMTPFRWSLSRIASGAGAMIEPNGCYTSGAGTGVDIVQVEDIATGQILQSAAEVRADATTIDLSVPVLMLPPGESYPVSASGTTGLYTFSLAVDDATGSAVVPDPTRPGDGFIFTAGDRPGETSVLVQDQYLTDLRTEVHVVVMGIGHHEVIPWGYHTDDMDMASVGDVNGDGADDVVLALRGGSLNGMDSGAAFLYLGGQPLEGGGIGLGAQPAQVITGGRRFNYLGKSLASGDFNNDGCPDVAIGVFGENLTGSEIGEVRVYTGCNTTATEVDPATRDWNGRLADNLAAPPGVPPLRLWRRIGGLNNTDRFGWGLAAGDFNGDGLTDLASSAARAESSARIDPMTGSPWTNIGRVFIFYQRPDGTLPDLPDNIVDGLYVTGQASPAWLSEDTLTLGGHMVAGRVNEDACDDLFIGSWHTDNSRGLASLYLSVPEGLGCRLAAEPALTIHPADADGTRQGRLGWRVALEDIDGDCQRDLLVSHPVSRVLGMNDSSTGNVLAFLNKNSWSHAAPQRLLRDAADWTASGDLNDQFGFGLALGDVTGDGLTDLVLGNRFGESPGTSNDIGEVRIYPGLIGGASCAGRPNPDDPLFGEPIVLSNRSYGNSDLFGQLTDASADVDGDGQKDVVIFAERGSASADPADTVDHQGRLFWRPSSAAEWTFESLERVDVPLVPADDRMGFRAEAAGDFNDDGFEDFVVAAPWWDQDVPQSAFVRVDGTAGAVYLFLGGANGVRAFPDAVFAGFAPHAGGDNLGYSVSAIGDMDGDGVDDIAIGMLGQDNDSWCVPCRVGNTARTDTGAVVIYRGDPGLTRRAASDPLPRLSAPSQVICGPPTTNARIGREVVGGFDFNGDGLGDVLTSNWDWSTQRGWVWWAPGAAVTTPYALTCLDDSHTLGEGVTASDLLGWGLGVADLNGDGCGDALASAYNDDLPGRANAGALHVWLGYGGPGCPSQTSHVRLYAATANDNVGYRLAVLGDLNGDGVDEVAMGSSGYGVTNVGAVIVYDGADLRALLAGARDGDALTLGSDTILAQLLQPERLPSTNFAYDLESAGDLNADGLPDLIVGERYSSFNGVLRRGAAWVYYGSADPIAFERPDVVIGGRALFPDSEFGTAVAARRLRRNGPAVILVGAPVAEWVGPRYGELGEVYIGTFNP